MVRCCLDGMAKARQHGGGERGLAVVEETEAKVVMELVAWDCLREMDCM